MSIESGRVVNCIHVTALPLPDDVVKSISRLARRQDMNPRLVFTDRNMEIFENNNDELSLNQTEDDRSGFEEENDDEGSDEDEVNCMMTILVKMKMTRVKNLMESCMTIIIRVPGKLLTEKG